MAAKPKDSGPTLTTAQLAARWSMDDGTLRNWRSDGIGPPYIQLGKRGKGKRPRVRYRLADIEAYEAANRRQA